MTALVPELANMASDPNVATTDLLRRALVAATRLNVPETAAWIKSELDGYDEDVPSYRVIYGELVVHHPYQGLTPYRIKSEELMDMITEHKERQSIPELERVLSKNESNFFTRGFPSQQENLLMQGMPFAMRPQLKFASSQIKGIVERTRNRILEWALELEGRGILGEGMTFTQQEKQIVQEQHIHISGVSDSQIQIGSNSSNQHQANHRAGDSAALKSVADALAAALDQSKASGDAADELRAEIATLKAQASSPRPKWEVVKASARCVKTIVEGAAGNVLGELAKPHVIALMALLPH